MKFFIDTANIEQIKEAQSLGILDGVTTNPSLMAKEGITGEKKILKHYVDICEIVDGDVSAEVISTNYKEIISEGEKLANLHSQIVVKVPMIKDGIKAIVVPGSQIVSKIAQQKALDKIFTDAGFEWRNAGCSMCLAMNPDKLVGDELCASSSNRNFKGRQGSPTGRTMLMSPLMVAAAAISGEIADSREIFA